VSDGRGLLEELKRRHVGRVAIAYAVVAWLLVQIATQVFPFFGIPDWVVRLLVVLVVLAFPVALLLAWVYEITPAGIRRTEPAESPDARTPSEAKQVGRRLDAVIITVLALAVIVLSGRMLQQRHALPPAMKSAASRPVAKIRAPALSPFIEAAQAIPAKSIAVLPFANLSDDRNNDYFVAGIQDLILTRLADIGDLRVISRMSTARYASSPDDLRNIGRQLGVATILEGSVQRADNQVLINVKLIDVRSDNHIWAQDYVRSLENVFGVEGEVAQKVADALKARLSPAESARLAAVPTSNRAAMDAFLRAEFQMNHGFTNYDSGSLRAAIPLYRRAVILDSGFALAFARLSQAQSRLAWFGGGGLDVKQLVADARVDAERAFKLDPDLSASWTALGYSRYWGEGDYAGALQAFTVALKLKPNDADALAAQGYVERRQGRFEDAAASLEQAFTHDPRNTALAFEIGTTYAMVNRYGEATPWYQRALAMDPGNLNAKAEYANVVLFATGDVQRALDAAQGGAPLLKLVRVSLLAYRRDYRTALTLLESVPDTSENFSVINGSKALIQAELHRLAGDAANARPLYERSLAEAKRQTRLQQGINLALVWRNVATAELGLGHLAAGLAAVAESQKRATASGDRVFTPQIMYVNATLYAEARRPDLAVPLLAQALASPGIGTYCAPVLLWIDPAWDPIRRDARFRALLKQYVKAQPAETTPRQTLRG
jgi:TolB-like protein